MRLTTSIAASICLFMRRVRRFACVYGVGGPVGTYHAWKLARLRRKMAQTNQYISREKELHREHLRTLDFEFRQLVDQQQALNIAAAQFWSNCEKWAGAKG